MNVHPHVPLNIANGKVYLEGDKVYTIVKQENNPFIMMRVYFSVENSCKHVSGPTPM